MRLSPIMVPGHFSDAFQKFIIWSSSTELLLCFRHSHITNLIAAEYSPADISKRVGHEPIYITLHYSHAFKHVEGDIVDSLDRIMDRL